MRIYPNDCLRSEVWATPRPWPLRNPPLQSTLCHNEARPRMQLSIELSLRGSGDRINAACTEATRLTVAGHLFPARLLIGKNEKPWTSQGTGE